ncbi:MAG: outer membrane lipoprotein LolB [Burkholderiales bacterium]|nr:MAG: outer membrane lipoprotein LolB [Burkholderiales bacterium]
MNARLAPPTRVLIALSAATLTACSSLSEPDPIVAQMRSGGACAPASSTESPAPPASPAVPLPTPETLTAPQAATTTPTPAHAQPHIDLQGQMSIKLAAFADQPAKGLSLGFFFSGNNDKGQLDLMTLMGSQMAQVNWEPGQAWLTTDKGRQRYDDLDTLSAAALGETLPLRQLVHWMQGHPDPDLPSLPGEQPESFTQQGWMIDTHELGSKKLQARRDGTPAQRGVQLKIYLDR